MKKILLVEDNEMNRDMLARRLQKRGFNLLLAEDGLLGVDADLPSVAAGSTRAISSASVRAGETARAVLRARNASASPEARSVRISRLASAFSISEAASPPAEVIRPVR